MFTQHSAPEKILTVRITVPHCFLCLFHLCPGCAVFLDLWYLFPMLCSHFILNKVKVVFSESLHKVKSHEKPTFTAKGDILEKKKVTSRHRLGQRDKACQETVPSKRIPLDRKLYDWLFKTFHTVGLESNPCPHEQT